MKINTFIIIIFITIYNISKEKKQRMICPYSSNITIKIKGTGMLDIFYGGDSCWTTAEIFHHPNEVYINYSKQPDVNNTYYFEGPENIVKLVWFESFNNCNCLFKNCENIIDIDFSNFDFS